MDKYICRYCGKVCKNDNSLRNHERLCKNNPDRQESYLMKKNKSENYVPWNKGLTKETDERVAKYASTQHQKIVDGETISYWKGKHLPKEMIEKMKNNPNCGGLRPGSGRGKMGYYKGYYCRSSWELAWIVYQIENGVTPVQCTEFFEYKINEETHRYYPDFKIGETYYEIKGAHYNKWEYKKEQFPKGKTLIIIDGKKEIKPYLQYVEEKYGKEFWKVLYD
jgi:hypothetical protein